jgi:DNA-nicking Smr family endonuclease
VLTAEEARLWSTVVRKIKPIAESPVESGALVAVDQKPAVQSTGKKKPVKPLSPEKSAPPLLKPASVAKKAPQVPFAPLERQLRRGLSRGSSSVDATIDLHGMRQAEAHERLRCFILKAQRDGLKVVLVVTGKGNLADHDPSFDQRGVLRRNLPLWLRMPDLRPAIIGFEEASRQHGGSGAFYVRIRKPNGDRSAL